MIYIAESGSTKCDAVFMSNEGEVLQAIRTIGFNPYFHNRDFVAREIVKVPEVQEKGAEVNAVYFYGAGCSSPELNQEISIGLKAGFPNAEIHVGHDLTAAAYCTYEEKESITCILGTGSNCVHFDGEKVTPGNSGFGFIIGDEGSASYIGKQLVRGFLYRTMPKHYRDEFFNTFHLSPEDIRENVYKKSGANVFLGNLAPFAHANIEDPYFYQLVFEGFREFVETQVLDFDRAESIDIHFVGSIAHHFEMVLRDVMAYFDLQLGQIIRRPISGLVEYHRKHILKLQKT